jgi:hypothetical protein
MCVWQSMNPGTTRRHFASITFVDGPCSFAISASEPTATMRPPRTASASASGRAGSPVQIFADFRTSSADAPAASGGAARKAAIRISGSGPMG